MKGKQACSLRKLRCLDMTIRTRSTPASSDIMRSDHATFKSANEMISIEVTRSRDQAEYSTQSSLAVATD